MYVALVVDDEEIIRKGICRKLGRFFPDIEIAPPQENAIEALHYIQNHPVDIVFVDIRMPMLDGLEFIRRARQYHSNLQFVVVSGYTSFEYAKEALRLHVKDYLLKPIDNKEFKEITERIIGELEKKDSTIKNDSIVRAQAEEGRFLKKNRYLTELIRVDSVIDTVELLKDLERAEVVFSHSHFRVISLVAQNFREVPEFRDVSGLYVLQFAICNIMNEVFMNCGCQVFAHEKHENQFIAILNTDTALATHFIYEKTKYLTDLLQNIYKIRSYAGIGLEVSRAEDICVSYTQAAESAIVGIMLGDKPVELFQGKEKQKFELQFLNELDKNVLEGYVRSQNEQGIREFIAKVFENCRQKGMNYTSIRTICFDLYMLLVKLLQEKGKYTDLAVEMLEQTEEKMQRGVKLLELEKFLAECITVISAQFDERKKGSGKVLVEEIREYVDMHYSKDISLSSIAGKFYLNPSYLSQLFKKEMNLKFIDYITGVRLKKAIELLGSTSLTVNEVAEAVGYKDARYFREIFVKHMGKTPSQFRKADEK